MKGLLFALLPALLFFGCDKEELTTVPEKQPNRTVEIISPSDGTAFQNSILIQVKAEDERGVVRVEIYIDNKTDDSRTIFMKPFEYVWKPPIERDVVKHAIFAKAYNVDDTLFSSKVITVYHSNFLAPTNLNAFSYASNGLELTWEDNSSLEKGFTIERKITNGRFAEIARTAENETTFIDTLINEENNYFYRVKSFNDTSMSAYSNIIEAYYNFSYVNSNSTEYQSANSDEAMPIIYNSADNSFIAALQRNNKFHYQIINSIDSRLISIGNSQDYITNISKFEDKRFIFSTVSGKVIGLDYPDFLNEKTFAIGDQEISDVAFLGNKSLFAAASVNGEIKIVDYENSEVISSYQDVNSRGKVLLAYDEASDLLISASESGYMSHWKVGEQELRLTQYLENRVTYLFYDEMKQLLYIGQGNGVIKIYDPLTNVRIDSAKIHNSAITGIGVGNNGETFVSTANDKIFMLWKTNDGLYNYYSKWDSYAMQKSSSVICSQDLNYIVTASDNKIYTWRNESKWKKL